jgi:nucleoside-diphosphate-sugar epimerase
MRIAITGGNGFIGSRVVALLKERGHDVVVLGRHAGADLRVDLLSPDAPRLVAEVGATHILHLAWVTEHPSFWNAPANIDWTAASLRILRAARDAGVVRFVAAGTCAEYAWPCSACDESVTAIEPSTLYATAKDAFRRIAQSYADEGDLSFAWGRTFFVYGPGEPPGKLISTLLDDLRAGRQPQLRDRDRRLDFVYVDDVARGFADLATNPDAVGAFNIGSGELHSVGQAVDFAARAVGNVSAELLPVTPSENAVGANLTRSRAAFGFTPRIDLQQGIALTAQGR